MVSVVLTGIFLIFCGVIGAQRPTVTVQQGTLQGVKLNTVWGKEYFAFRGIRYAKPPVGKLRFQASWFLYAQTVTLTDTELPHVQAVFSLTK
jgi:carboxylesterase type B